MILNRVFSFDVYSHVFNFDIYSLAALAPKGRSGWTVASWDVLRLLVIVSECFSMWSCGRRLGFAPNLLRDFSSMQAAR